MFHRKQQKKFGIIEESLLFGSWNSQNAKLNRCHFHYLKNGLLLSSFSLYCRCFLRGLLPIFGAMSPVAFPSWKASYTHSPLKLILCLYNALFISVLFCNDFLFTCYSTKTVWIHCLLIKGTCKNSNIKTVIYQVISQYNEALLT